MCGREKKKPERGRKIMKIGDGAAVATVRGYNGGLLSPGAKKGENLCGKVKRGLAKK